MEMGPTVYLVTPLTEQMKDWFKEHLTDETTWLGESLAVGHRFIENLVTEIEFAHFIRGLDFEISY